MPNKNFEKIPLPQHCSREILESIGVSCMSAMGYVPLKELRFSEIYIQLATYFLSRIKEVPYEFSDEFLKEHITCFYKTQLNDGSEVTALRKAVHEHFDSVFYVKEQLDTTKVLRILKNAFNTWHEQNFGGDYPFEYHFNEKASINEIKDAFTEVDEYFKSKKAQAELMKLDIKQLFPVGTNLARQISKDKERNAAFLLLEILLKNNGLTEAQKMVYISTYQKLLEQKHVSSLNLLLLKKDYTSLLEEKFKEIEEDYLEWKDECAPVKDMFFKLVIAFFGNKLTEEALENARQCRATIIYYKQKINAQIRVANNLHNEMTVLYGKLNELDSGAAAYWSYLMGRCEKEVKKLISSEEGFKELKGLFDRLNQAEIETRTDEITAIIEEFEYKEIVNQGAYDGITHVYTTKCKEFIGQLNAEASYLASLIGVLQNPNSTISVWTLKGSLNEIQTKTADYEAKIIYLMECRDTLQVIMNDREKFLKDYKNLTGESASLDIILVYLSYKLSSLINQQQHIRLLISKVEKLYAQAESLAETYTRMIAKHQSNSSGIPRANGAKFFAEESAMLQARQGPKNLLLVRRSSI